MVTRPNQLLDAVINAGLRSRVEGDYAAARKQFEEALRLDPTSAEAHRYLGQTLSYQAADVVEDPRAKEAALDEAEKMVRQAEALQGGESPDSLHDMAWIEDERGRYETAIALYRKARDQARREAREENIGFTYNLVCALAKFGALDDALEELSSVINEAWKWAERDPDLENLRNSPVTSQRLQRLISEAKSAFTKKSNE